MKISLHTTNKARSKIWMIDMNMKLKPHPMYILKWFEIIHSLQDKLFFQKVWVCEKTQLDFIFLNYICSFLPTLRRCSVPLFFCPPNFGRSSSSSPQSLSQSTFHRAASKGHNICSRKVCSAVFSRVFFCFVKKDRPLVTVCDNFVTICVPSFSPQLLLFSLVKKGKPCFNEFFLHTTS